MKILYIGCVKSSYCFLEVLIRNNKNIVGVITKEKSNFNSDFMDLTQICKKYHIPYIYVENINQSITLEFIHEREADVGYCFGWSQLIDNRIINMFPLGMVGYHPAQLPYNRGRHPIIWALALGLKKTASTFFMLDEKADTGNIISQSEVIIEYEDNAETLMNKLIQIGKKQVLQLTSELEDNNINYVLQDLEIGNSWRKRRKEDGKIDWRMSSKSIYNLVRALTKPYIGAHFIKDNRDVKVWKVREVFCTSDQYINIEPGKIVDVTEDTFIVKTGENLIEVLEYDEVTVSIGEYLF